MVLAVISGAIEPGKLHLFLSLSRFRKKRHKSRVFNRFRELSLVFRAGTGLTSRRDLAIRIDEPAEKFDVLVIDMFNMILGEVTNFFPWAKLFECHVEVPF